MDSSRILYHRLLWQPGYHMHEAWWQALGLADWQQHYRRRLPQVRRELDRLICRRRAFPESRFPGVGGAFTPLQAALLRGVPRLPMLMLALGLLLSGCPDYVLWRPYRDALAGWLDEQQRQQLWGMWRYGHGSADVAPQELASFAGRCGVKALELALADDPVWQAVRYVLPAPADAPAPTVALDTGLFMRLERFL